MDEEIKDHPDETKLRSLWARLGGCFVFSFRALLVLVGGIALFGVAAGYVAMNGAKWFPTPDQAYRDAPCVAEAELVADEDVDGLLGDSWSCRTQVLKLGETASAFTLSFLEFTEAGTFAGEPTPNSSSAQFDEFFDMVRADEKSYVIVFAHGWRNNADHGNGDVRKFQTLLSYAAAFIDQRCDDDPAYCGMRVRGLYVGWRGSSFHEPGADALASFMSAATFMDRKVLSDGIPLYGTNGLITGLPASVSVALQKIDAELDLRKDGAGGSDRMLVMGHSLGANLLLQGFKSTYVAAIKNHVPGHIMRPPVGDLMVLINPATSAADWTEITDQVRGRTVPVANIYWRYDGPTHDFFADRQPPVLIALTATCPFADEQFDRWGSYWQGYFQSFASGFTGSDATGCDWVTAFALPLAQILLNDARAFGRVAMGQLVPTEKEDKTWPPQIRGITHGVELNTSADAATTLANSRNPDVNQCENVDGWLYEARLRNVEGDPKGHGLNWDAGYTGSDVIPNLSPVRLAGPGGLGRLEVQFAHGGSINRTANLITTDPVTAANDPFWNVAANGNAIQNHGGYVSYQLWCALNQFVLDDTTGINAPGSS